MVNGPGTHPGAVTGRSVSLFRQATLRLAGIFIISLLLFGLAIIWLYNAAIDKAGQHEIANAANFYSASIDEIERRWLVDVQRFKNGLEFTRLLEEPQTRWLKMNSFLVAQGAVELFSHVVITNPKGQIQFRYGDRVEELPDGVLLRDAAEWYFRPDDRSLFRVYHLPIWLGPEGMGRMVALVPADNALLNRAVAQDTRLYLIWHGTVAATSSLTGKSEGSLDPGRNFVEINGKRYVQQALEWKSAPGEAPALLVQRQIKSLFSASQYVLGVAAVLAALILLTWLVLGLWLVRTARRMAMLGEVSRHFSREYQITPEIRRRLDASCAGQQDEITTVARSLEDLTLAVMERTREREVRESQLRESEARTREVMATMADGLLVLDRKGDLSYVNPEAERLLGWKAEEMLGRNAHAIFHSRRPDGTSYCIDDCPVYSAFHQGRVYRGNEIFCRQDGSFMPVIVSSSPIRHNDRIEGMVLAFHDISELKRAERALQQSEAEYRSILDNMRDTYFRAGLRDGATQVLSSSCLGLLGYESEELIGTGFFDVFAYLQARVEFLSAVEQGGGKVFDHEMPLRHKNGREVWVSANAHYFYDEQGVLAGIEGTLRDISQRRAMELELTRSRDDLELRVAERTLELMKARDESERANMAKTEFLARMSHELRTPLNAVLGFAQLLESDATCPLQRQQKDSVVHILDAGWHLLGLVNEVLDLSSIEQGRLKLAIGPVELGPVTDRCVGLAAQQAAERGIEIVNPIPAGWPVYVLADEGRLGQVLSNLLSNAIKFNQEKGRVTLSCQTLPENWVRIGVQDSGGGIPEEMLDQLFKPFNRLAFNKDLAGGTGIGLSLVKQLVEMMGGSVGVESGVGQGSLFWIKLRQAPGTGMGQTPGV